MLVLGIRRSFRLLAIAAAVLVWNLQPVAGLWHGSGAGSVHSLVDGGGASFPPPPV